ncbi:MAG: 2-hydroxyacid dehydrogenase [Acidimicrobiales bacterium]
MRVIATRLLEDLQEEVSGVEFSFWDAGHDEDLPRSILESCEVYIPTYMSRSQPFAILPELSNLRLLQLLTAGVDTVLPLVPPGVALANAKGVHDASTAELAVALMLASLRGFPSFIRSSQTGAWHPLVTNSLADRRILILGYGSVGIAIERRLLPFEVTIDRVARRPREGVFGLEDLATLVPQVDIVVAATPLTSETHHLINDDFLSSMRDGSLLVNVARGPVVDTDALTNHLAAQRLSAALDVTDPEPLPPNHPLWTLPNCLITPHVGGATSAFTPRIKALVADNLQRYVVGEPLRNVVTSSY